jgi:hypothetical protein
MADVAGVFKDDGGPIITYMPVHDAISTTSSDEVNTDGGFANFCLVDGQQTCTIEVICEALGGGKFPPWMSPAKKPQWYAWHCEIEVVSCNGAKTVYAAMQRGEPVMFKDESGPGGVPVRVPSVIHKATDDHQQRNPDGTFVNPRWQSRGKTTHKCIEGCLFGFDPCDIEWLVKHYPHMWEFELTGKAGCDDQKNCSTFASWLVKQMGLEVEWTGYELGVESQYSDTPMDG